MTRRRRQRDGGAVALPITPMLDMSFQLLFFFIATFHLPTGMEGQMPLAVTAKAVEGPTRGSDEVNLRAPVTIALKADAAGQSADGVSALTLVEQSGETPLPYSKDLKELRQNLAEVSWKSGSDQAITVQGDGKVKWRGVVRVMDACREAGFADVTFAQPAGDGSR